MNLIKLENYKALVIFYKDPIGDQLRNAEGYYVYFLAPFKDVDFNEA
jgi:hypothetical protein